MNNEVPVHIHPDPAIGPNHVNSLNDDTIEQTNLHHNSIRFTRQPVFSTLHIYVKASFRTLLFRIWRFVTEIRDVTIGNASFQVNLNTGPFEDSCYIEYVSVNLCWRASVCPNDIPSRAVEEGELTSNCEQLFNTAGCVFKTRASTDSQNSKPVEIPSRSLRSVMRSLGFCEVDSGTLYRVYKSRIGRPIDVIVTIVAVVGLNGENQGEYVGIAGDKLVMKVEVLQNERVAAVVQSLEARDRGYRITLNGREEVKKKLRSSCSILLV